MTTVTFTIMAIVWLVLFIASLVPGRHQKFVLPATLLTLLLASLALIPA